jgi:predicted phosphodiesterase
MRIAAISDVHGNLWALEAVLRDIRRRGADRVLNLGDSLFGPLAPRETALLLREAGILSIRGNRDRILSERADGNPGSLMTAFVRSELGDAECRWLLGLPPTEVIEPDVFLCHGSILSDEVYLFERVSRFRVRLRSEAELSRRTLDIRQSLILCGHSHVFRARALSGGKTIVNPGSVGLPVCRHTRPFPHTMAAGSPHARYALIQADKKEYRVLPVQVEYCWDRAAAAALAGGRPDWAVWLRWGRA